MVVRATAAGNLDDMFARRGDPSLNMQVARVGSDGPDQSLDGELRCRSGLMVVKLVGWSLGLRRELKGDPLSSKADQIPLNLSLPHLKVLTLHPPVSREAGSCMGENRTLNDPTDSDCRRDHCRPRARGSGHIHFRKWLSALVTGVVNGAIFVGGQAYS